jgi:hypothetical protein
VLPVTMAMTLIAGEGVTMTTHDFSGGRAYQKATALALPRHNGLFPVAMATYSCGYYALVSHAVCFLCCLSHRLCIEGNSTTCRI